MSKLLDMGLQSGMVAETVERRPPSSPPAIVPTSTLPAPERRPSDAEGVRPAPDRPPKPQIVRVPEPTPAAGSRADQAAPAGRPAVESPLIESRSPEPSPAESPSETTPAGPEIRMGVGSCLPPPPSDSVIPWEELPPMTAWEQLVSRIREGDEFLAAVLGDVGLVSLAAGVLRVAAPRGSFAHTELSRNAQRRAQVDQATRDHLGAPFALELVEGEPSLPDLPSIDLVVKQRRAEHRARVEAEAKAHPGIQVLLRMFDGQLLGTKPLHEP
jgi:hypothetical protein